MHEFIKWDDVYKTGNYVIDYQHKRLVRAINDVAEVSKNSELKQSLLHFVIDELFNYTKYHFSTEEALMKRMNYSQVDEHKVLHAEFVEKLKVIKDEFETKNREIDHELLSFLKDWLMGHILEEDVQIIKELMSGNGLV
jgi:hemerythrin-like metal-binding protein